MRGMTGSNIPYKELSNQVFKNLDRITKFNFLEQYAIFMVKVQLIEQVLKEKFIERYGYTQIQLDKKTLGATISELEKLKIRKDFIDLLKDLNDDRKEMAHHLLAVTALLDDIVGNKFKRLSWKILWIDLRRVEMTTLVYDFLSENNKLWPVVKSLA